MSILLSLISTFLFDFIVGAAATQGRRVEQASRRSLNILVISTNANVSRRAVIGFKFDKCIKDLDSTSV